MKRVFSVFIFCAISGIVFWSCNTKTQYDTNFGSNYQDCKQFVPMQVGATQLYRLDSISPTAFGAALVTRSYLIEDSVGRQTLDAVGDTTFEVYRFITDTLQMQPWSFLLTYRVVYTPKTVDFIQDDNTLRFIKLTYPVENGFSWDGNRYFAPDNGTAADTYYPYEGWNYQYDSVGMPFTTIYGATFPNTITVNEVNSKLGNTGDFNSSLYQEVKYSEAVYAQNVGLVYQNTLFYIYQPSGSAQGFDPSSFGIIITRLQ
jgi:hypothetical protein